MVTGHGLKMVLVEPEIPQNAGNIARLCAATGVGLHVVRPLGFILSDKHFKRAGMDYLKDLEVTVHDDLPGLILRIGRDPVVLTTGLLTEGSVAHWEMRYRTGSWIFMGKESAGLPADLLRAYPRAVARIPMVEGTRGLNVATAAGVVVYEALRQLSFQAVSPGDGFTPSST